jgi:hypothetical protein
MRLCPAGAGLFAVGRVYGGRQRPSLSCGLEPLLTAALRDADTNLMSAVSTTPAQTAAEAVAFPRVLARSLALPLIFVAATAYHFLQSRGHATTTVFNDELLYAKLSQSIAAGHGLSIRGEHFFFPAPLASLVQAPAWLIFSLPDAYAVAKFLNAAVMSAAAFPAYWLARQVVRPSFALLTAAAAVATPAMFYHGYLMSEALAYPVFLATVAILVRALAAQSRRLALEVPAICVVAIATRVQFLVLPLAYLIGVAICGRGAYRRHLVPAALTALLVAALVGLPGVLGQYGQASTQLGHDPGALAHWALSTGVLLPYGLGLAIVPGALFGLGLMFARPRASMERAIATLTVTCTTFFLGQALLISAGEAQRPLERYLFYVTPLFFLAFFAYAERGAPRRFLYGGLGCIGALLLSNVSLPGMTGTAAFFFDAPTLTGYARAAYRLGFPNASLLYFALPLALALLTSVVPLTRRGAPHFFALVAIGLMGVSGAAVYATDRLSSGWDVRTFGADPQDWLDRSGLGPARYLSLPRSNDFFGTQVESWNRDLQGIVVLGKPATDPYPVESAHVATDGRLVIDGRPTRSEVFVVNVNGSAIDLEGRVVASPREDLVAYRVPANAHVRSLARGLSPDGWARERLEYRVWPQGAGRYELTLTLPKGTPPRKAMLTVGAERRTVTIRAMTRLHLSIPTTGAPLKLAVEVPGAALGGRILGVQVLALRFVRT